MQALLNWLRETFSFGRGRSQADDRPLIGSTAQGGVKVSGPVVSPAQPKGSDTTRSIKLQGLPSLGQALVDNGMITKERLQQALTAHKQERSAPSEEGGAERRSFVDLLVADGFATRADVDAVLQAMTDAYRAHSKRVSEAMGQPYLTCDPPVPEIRQYGLRFDMEVIGANHKTPSKATHWKVRITALPAEGLPLVLGGEYSVPVDNFGYATFIGDHVEAEWDGDQYSEFSTFKHGWTPDSWPRNATEALEHLRLLHKETLAADVPLNHVAGRSKFASYLLDRVMGEISVWKEYPRGALAIDKQGEAVLLAAAILEHLTMARIEQVSRNFGSHPEGCRRLIAAAKKTDLSGIRWAMEFVHSHMPSRRPSRQEVESIGRMFAMARQADQNYGRGTGDRVIEVLLGAPRPAGGIIQ